MISDYEKRPGILAQLGFGSLSDPEETEMMRSAMVELYGFCRLAGPGMKFPADDPTFGADWVDLGNSKAVELAYACVALEDPALLRNPKQLVRRELEARDWNDVLGFDHPTVTCKIRIHGQKWGIRFQTTGVLRGQELRNAELPAATGGLVDADGDDKDRDRGGNDGKPADDLLKEYLT